MLWLPSLYFSSFYRFLTDILRMYFFIFYHFTCFLLFIRLCCGKLIFFLHLHCLLILSMFIISSLSSCCLIFCQFKFLNTKFCCFLFFRIVLIYIFLQLKKDLFSFLKTFFYTDKKLIFVFNF